MAKDGLPAIVWQRKFEELRDDSRRKLKHARRVIVDLMKIVDRDLPPELQRQVDRQLAAHDKAIEEHRKK